MIAIIAAPFKRNSNQRKNKRYIVNSFGRVKKLCQHIPALRLSWNCIGIVCRTTEIDTQSDEPAAGSVLSFDFRGCFCFVRPAAVLFSSLPLPIVLL